MSFDRAEDLMKMVLEDTGTPRTVREKLSKMLAYLEREDLDSQTKVNTVQSELEEISADVNIPPFVRTQIYGISSELEAALNE